MKPVYFDSFASMPTLPCVRSAMAETLGGHSANPHSTHTLGLEAAQSVDAVLEALADLYGGLPENYVLTSGATEANNLAIREGVRMVQRSRIVTTAVEHQCVLQSAYASAKAGASITVCPVEMDGSLAVSSLEAALKEGPALVSIMAANNEVGSLNDIAALAVVSHEANSLFHTDAAQITTHCEFNVEDLDVDLASFSAHKIGGPIGIGALYVGERAAAMGPLIAGGGQQEGRRSGTLSPLLCDGYAAALRTWKEQGEELRQKADKSVAIVCRVLADLLEDFPLLGPDLQGRHRANLAIRLGDNADYVFAHMFNRVCVSDGAACSSGAIRRSHVLDAIRLPMDAHMMRLSFHPHLERETVLRGANTVREALLAHG